MIPRIIYKIWVGNNPQPEIFNKYLESWKNAECLIYEIGNDDVQMCLFETQSKFLKWAIENDKYALINHYLRYWLLYKNGGIYLDLDIQVLKRFEFNSKCLHIGLESERWLNNCVMAAPARHEFFKDCLDYMETVDINTLEIELETGPRLVTNLIVKYSEWKPSLMRFRSIYEYKDNFVCIYPERYFSPHRWYQEFTTKEIGTDTVCVHHFEHSWK